MPISAKSATVSAFSVKMDVKQFAVAVDLVRNRPDDRLVPFAPEVRADQGIAARGTSDAQALEGSFFTDGLRHGNHPLEIPLLQLAKLGLKIRIHEIKNCGLETSLPTSGEKVEKRNSHPGLQQAGLPDPLW
jgi:hypothetical protein